MVLGVADPGSDLLQGVVDAKLACIDNIDLLLFLVRRFLIGIKQLVGELNMGRLLCRQLAD